MTRTAPSCASAGPAVSRAGSSDRAIAAWLLACCALVFAMVVVGGVTRITTYAVIAAILWYYQAIPTPLLLAIFGRRAARLSEPASSSLPTTTAGAEAS